MTNFENIFSGGDLRTLGKSAMVISKIKNQNDFDELFKCLFHQNRLIVMRAADTIEKISRKNPKYLSKYKTKIIKLCEGVTNKELQWHLAQIVDRLNLNKIELKHVWRILKNWTMGRNNSKVVRVNSLQSLFNLKDQNRILSTDFVLILQQLEKENIPSINARINILKNST